VKRKLLTLLRRCGVFASFRYLNKTKVLIVTYHRFSKEEDGRSTSVKAFAEQLDHLKDHYSVLSLSELGDCLNNRKPLPLRAATITIDDGFYDAYEIAFPQLRERALPATVFVITDFVDQKIWLWTDKLRYLMSQLPDGPVSFSFEKYDLTFRLDGAFSRSHAAGKINSLLKTFPESIKNAAINEMAESLNLALPEQPPAEYAAMTWDQVREMNRACIEIGSHTVTHPILPNVDDEQLRHELIDSRTKLEHELGRPVTLFCYPNGSYDERVEAAVRKAGYNVAVTTIPRLNDQRSDPHALARVPAELDLDHFEQTTSGLEQFKNRALQRQVQ
jgi:peptidoglycan/xylan/chitin deacetylase (PgdA/CDA1 family)